MPPKYIFRIDEFTEHPDAVEQFDNNGQWIPMSIPGYNIRCGGGISGQYWWCDGSRIRLLPEWTPPTGSRPYKTFSTIFCGGNGLRVLYGDAITPAAHEVWHHLRFEWDETRYTSAITNTGPQATLRVHNSGLRWPYMLLPDIYHGPAYPYAGYGGLTGDLPIFLALIALSMRPEVLSTELPKMMRDGQWRTHQNPTGRSDKRGVIVYVYEVEGNRDELEALEHGQLGFYYN
ncbi:hypothetical protein FB567DRAFT_595629 [Paraphoma chrysanthemicola]|uniref:Uncharacterized protein n=1 Tax=Paraphoma chrysanthemicola TaxID=798071 RepID=A0A8K0QZ55_9PLEO|nr:hypothetical protein FB567DRAFT_595629 [Paraphoma chrysanthemicola]